MTLSNDMLLNSVLKDLTKNNRLPTQPSSTEIRKTYGESIKIGILQNTTNKKGINGKLFTENF